MSKKELVFASVYEALQHLADVADARVFVAGSKMHPDPGDFVIILNPRTDHYHVLRYPDGGIRQFHNSDSVKDIRGKGGTGKDMTFPDSKDPLSIAKIISDMFAAMSMEKRKELDAEGVRGIYLADSVPSDLDDDISAKSKIDFDTDRVYRGISSLGLQKSNKQIQQDKERRKKQIKKAPKDRYTLKKEDFDSSNIPAKLHDISKADLQKVFASSGEALQHLADITGKVVRIND